MKQALITLGDKGGESTEQIEPQLLAGHHNTGMAKSLPHRDHLVEGDYINMDIGPSATFLYYTTPSPAHSREFEFQMSANPRDRESTTTSPADELFYKGNLLPLHLPPRLQMLQKLLQSSTTPPRAKPPDTFEKKMATTPTTNISPATTGYVSGELDAEDCLFECSIGLLQSNPEKSWSGTLKSIRHSSLGLKLKASRAYLKSFFTKSSCSDGSCAVPEAKECSNGHAKAGKKKPFGQIQRETYPVADNSSAAALTRIVHGEKPNEEELGHRKSFSGIIRWNSITKSSSTSSSCSSSFSNASSNGCYQPQILKRSSSVNSEVESSIQGAIAYCKKSQQLACARKSASDVGYYSVCF